MPVIVVGADCPVGQSIVEALLPRSGEIRAFVSDPAAAARLKSAGVKAAVGDVSDGSHVGGAALNAFAAVLIAEAATDERERAFATTPDEVFAAWADGLRDAGVTRVIWVGDDEHRLPGSVDDAVPETATVDRSKRTVEEVASEVARLDEAADLG